MVGVSDTPDRSEVVDSQSDTVIEVPEDEIWFVEGLVIDATVQGDDLSIGITVTSLDDPDDIATNPNQALIFAGRVESVEAEDSALLKLDAYAYGGEKVFVKVFDGESSAEVKALMRRVA